MSELGCDVCMTLPPPEGQVVVFNIREVNNYEFLVSCLDDAMSCNEKNDAEWNEGYLRERGTSQD